MLTTTRFRAVAFGMLALTLAACSDTDTTGPIAGPQFTEVEGTEYTSNPSCPAGYFSVKFDGPIGGGGPRGEDDGTGDASGLHINITNGDGDGEVPNVAWSSTYPVFIVFVKASNGGIRYDYEDGAFSGSGTTPRNNNAHAGVSHVEFCYKIPVGVVKTGDVLFGSDLATGDITVTNPSSITAVSVTISDAPSANLKNFTYECTGDAVLPATVEIAAGGTFSCTWSGQVYFDATTPLSCALGGQKEGSASNALTVSTSTAGFAGGSSSIPLEASLNCFGDDDDDDDDDDDAPKWCSPGYWKNHLGDWPAAYTPGTVLTEELGTNLTLLALLNLSGKTKEGGMSHGYWKNLVADLLSAEHPDLNWTGPNRVNSLGEHDCAVGVDTGDPEPEA